VGLFSGGMDSLTACHYAEVKEVLYCKTGIGINFDYVLETCKKLSWKLNVVEPKENESFEDFVRKFGFPHQPMHGAVMGFLKWHPLRKWHRENKERDIVFVSGRRRKESQRRMMKNIQEYEKTEGMVFCSPIKDWTKPQVFDYLKENDLELSPTYATMHMSGDCFCGAFSRKGESFLLKVFHKELSAKIKALEEKYNSSWGNYTSMKELNNQTTLDDLVCMECVNNG